MSAESRSARRTTLVTIILSVLILVPSIYGFGSKFLEFLHTFRGAAEGRFAITPIVNYMLASIGFLFLFVWAIVNGMFHDIEQPKYTLLEREAELDRKIR